MIIASLVVTVGGIVLGALLAEPRSFGVTALIVIAMLIAVPAAAAVGVLVRFGIQQYRHSRLYLGSRPRSAKDGEA